MCGLLVVFLGSSSISLRKLCLLFVSLSISATATASLPN